MGTLGGERGPDFAGTARFKVLRCIGAGGMGVVYEAYDREKRANVAIKTLKDPSPNAVLRLKREFRALQDIEHRNLVSLGELFNEADTWFFTMELLQGTNFLSYVSPTWQPQTPDMAANADTLDATTADHGALEQTRAHHRFDEGRLRDCLSQLSAGLDALHTARKLHRDVKPSNILVTGDGRVVLLDFGLVTSADRPGHSEVNVVGTALYMAPEQGLGSRVGPAADWYSVGVVLYEALVGTPPFVGPNLKVLLDKQRLTPNPPHTYAAHVPADLSALAMDLLRFDPDERPNGQRIQRRLGVHSGALALPSSRQTMDSTFLGREAELELLAAALADVRSGEQVAVLLEGESGIGKSALMRHFCEQAATEDDRVVVLSGRCYERETVPYKAVDGVLDELASYMRRLSRVDAAALTPQWTHILLQTFPVLARVDVFATAPRRDVQDVKERRTRLFEALRELLNRLAERRTVVIAIDDLQWADPDGLMLLSEILRPPDAPPLLLLASWREPHTEHDTVRERLAKLPGTIRHITLDKLSTDTTTKLATLLLVRNSLLPAHAHQIAREAEGHPMFVDELVRFVAQHGADAPLTPGALRLDDALRQRISALDSDALHVLEFASIAGAPLEQRTCANAASIESREYPRILASLQLANLARTGGTRATDRVEPYHDRIRAAVLAQIEPERLPGLHSTLARSLEATGHADPEALALHYGLSGDDEKAAAFAVQAAEQSARVLAFDQSAHLYQMALDLTPEEADAYPIRVALGSALAKSGRGAEAAEVLLTAARSANVAEALDLRARAIQALLNAGRFDRGVEELRDILASHGISYPKTAKLALLSVVRHRLALALRGWGFTERDASQVASDQLALVDLHYYAGTTLGMIDNIRGNAFQVRGVRLALKAGERYRVARALAFEAGYRAMAGGPMAERVRALLSRAEELGSKAKEAHLPALLLAVQGSAAFFQGRYVDALALCQRAQEVARERGVTDFAEYNIMYAWIARSLHYTGKMTELASFLDHAIRDAEHRGNLYVSTTLRTSTLPFVRLAADDPDGALQELTDALERWSPQRFHVQHYYALYAAASADLYGGDGLAAWRRLDREWPELKRALLLRPQIIRLLMWDLRGRAALAAAHASDAAERRRLLTAAERDARRLLREKMMWSNPLAHLLQAGIARLQGDDARALRLLEQATEAFDAVGMQFHASVARRRLGELVGGAEGQASVETATQWMTSEKIMDPTRTTNMMAPFPPTA